MPEVEPVWSLRATPVTQFEVLCHWEHSQWGLNESQRLSGGVVALPGELAEQQ